MVFKDNGDYQLIKDEVSLEYSSNSFQKNLDLDNCQACYTIIIF